MFLPILEWILVAFLLFPFLIIAKLVTQQLFFLIFLPSLIYFLVFLPQTLWRISHRIPLDSPLISLTPNRVHAPLSSQGRMDPSVNHRTRWFSAVKNFPKVDGKIMLGYQDFCGKRTSYRRDLTFFPSSVDLHGYCLDPPLLLLLIPLYRNYFCCKKKAVELAS